MIFRESLDMIELSYITIYPVHERDGRTATVMPPTVKCTMIVHRGQAGSTYMSLEVCALLFVLSRVYHIPHILQYSTILL